MEKKHDIQLLIARTLRIGVSIACLVAFAGGIIYLAQHGSDPMPDYTTFHYGEAPADYTTLSGIIEGLCNFTAHGWIQFGVLLLLLTPITRVLLSLVDFVQEKDWLYAAITAIVLGVIVVNSLGGNAG